jgi:hypothetical protein
VAASRRPECFAGGPTGNGADEKPLPRAVQAITAAPISAVPSTVAPSDFRYRFAFNQNTVEHTTMVARRPVPPATNQERFEIRPHIVGLQSAIKAALRKEQP